jgi:hypothetical protein
MYVDDDGKPKYIVVNTRCDEYMPKDIVIKINRVHNRKFDDNHDFFQPKFYC